MLELLAVLYPYLILLYCTDCLVYIEKQQIAFIHKLGRRFYKVKAGIHFAGFLPGSRIFITGHRPYCLTRSGMYLLSRQRIAPADRTYPENYDLFPYAAMDTFAAEGAAVILNNSVTISTSCQAEARLLARLLEDLKTTDYAHRLALIEGFMQKSSDLAAIKTECCRLTQKTRVLNLLSFLLFACFFVMIPVILYLWPVPMSFFNGLGALMLILYTAIR